MPQFEKIFVTVTPTISTSAYADGDHLGSLMAIDTFRNWSVFMLDDIEVIDLAQQSAEIDIFFWAATPTFTSSDNAAFALSDAQITNCIGVVTIPAASYADTAAQSVATVDVKKVLLSEDAPSSDSDVFTIYAQAVSRGTPTYADTDELIFKFGLRLD